MAKKRGPKAPPSIRSISDPPAKENVTLTTLPSQTLLHRVHPEQYGATEFNGSKNGDARFSPMIEDDGVVVPTVYAGTTLDCALMETAFHDVAKQPGFKTQDKAKLRRLSHSTISTTADLQLAALTTVALTKLGLNRRDIIDTEADRYPETRAFARMLRDACPELQGLTWVSRQDDTARAFVFFEDRMPAHALKQEGVSRNVLTDDDTYQAVQDLSERLGVLLT